LEKNSPVKEEFEKDDEERWRADEQQGCMIVTDEV
jgi:hypothetical protein